MAMTPGHKLDRIDINILAHLQSDGRMSNVRLAEAVALSPSPCLQRVKRLEKLGYIKRYDAEIDINLIAETIHIFTQMTLSEHRLTDHQHFEKEIAKIPQIMECHLVSGGGFDYWLKFVCRSIQEYQKVIQDMLNSDLKIIKYHSFVIMRSVINRRDYPIKELWRPNASSDA